MSGFNELQLAIVRVHHGEKHFPTAAQLVGHKHLPGHCRLSPRQNEVLKLFAEGNSVKEVSIFLGLSAKTVEVHKSNLMEKLSIHNKAQLVMYAVRHKVVSVSGEA
jgi:DNA-binding NarL/FixJ family response regulator